jgi:hypothetical protein
VPSDLVWHLQGSIPPKVRQADNTSAWISKHYGVFASGPLGAVESADEPFFRTCQDDQVSGCIKRNGIIVDLALRFRTG